MRPPRHRQPSPVLARLVAGLALVALALAGHASEESGSGPQVIARVAVHGDGFVRVRGEALAALGVDDARTVEVRRGNLEVPLARGDAEGARDLVFLALETARPWSAFSVYELVRLPAPRPPRLAPIDPPERAGAAVPWPHPRARRAVAHDRMHGPLAAARAAVYDGDLPTSFLARIAPGDGVNLTLEPMGAEPGTPQRLEVRLYASRLGTVRLEASWGGHAIGTAEAPSAAGGARLVFEVSAQAVPHEGAALTLRDVSPPAPPAAKDDVSPDRGALWIDELTLEGPVTRVVSEALGVFEAEWRAPPTLRPARGTSAGAPMYLTFVGRDGAPLGVPTVLEALETQGTDVEPGDRLFVAHDLPEGARLYASMQARDVTPTPVGTRPNPLARARDAEHLILAVPALLEPARRLAEHRARTGTPSVVVPVADVYDRYGHGEESPGAIRAFLVDRMAHGTVPLRFVVLAGDATHDRTDMLAHPTIPAPMARTMYNGATASDRLYTLPPTGESTGGPAVGRLPFGEAEELAAYVDRLVRYETAPPAHPTRRLMRFITSEARFGALIDGLIERMFRSVVSTEIPPAYDIEVTFASPTSPYLWPPPEFSAKVVQGLNDGCLFYTYVGHGFEQGFDTLRVDNRHYPILHVSDALEVAVEGTPPAMFVVACSTAVFDTPGSDGIGEALLKRPAGPLAYWGATRICHPAANSLLGRSIARFMARGEGSARLGDILDRARDEVLRPSEPDPGRMLLDAGIALMVPKDGEHTPSVQRLAREGALMYELLGDPALRLAFPRADVVVHAELTAEGGAVTARAKAPLVDGTLIRFSLELPRDRDPARPERVARPLDPASFATIRENHRRMNDWALARAEAPVRDGVAEAILRLPEGQATRGLVVKAWAVTEQDVHQGAVILP